jgi:acetate kinase
MMGTRSGDIDPGVIFFIHRELGLTIDRIDDLLNRESGLLGISSVSNDMREIEKKARSGDKRCLLAMEIFAYKIKKYIGAYAAALGGVDALVFTAGIGENSYSIRSMICEGLKFLGIELDGNRNRNTVGIEQIISLPDSRVSILVVPANEEEIIAFDTLTVADLPAKVKS